MLFKLLRYAVDETADRDLGGGRRLIEGARHRRPSCVYFFGDFLVFLVVAIIAATYRNKPRRP